MTGHHPFSELTAKLPATRKERIAARAIELQTQMAPAELRQALVRVPGTK